ncbi:MAG: DNA/RNA non-specific endonuclease [Candidatus Amulumruptor caecigallinarius]|nr:DNA/RNA non-specific endonuclease [Candidatus Amulumruptor caecigallinarius]
MKKAFPIIITLVFIFMIVAGVAGLRSAGHTEQAGATGIAAAPSSTDTSLADALPPSEVADELLNVIIPNPGGSTVKDYEGFRLSFNHDNHTPDWVAWELLASETAGPTKRYSKFWQDTSLRGCAETNDYTKSGYDRGHMCPAADQKWSEEAMRDCFSLANICPQNHSLNSGAWSTLEKKERLWAQRDKSLVIVAGPIYSPEDTKRIGNTGVRVPSAFFKAILALNADKPRAIAFVYPNMTSPGNMANYAMSVDELEQLTGYDFFAALDDETEAAVESAASFKDWN